MPETVAADETDVSQPWDQDNQAWWDWYVSLAENDGADDALIASAPLPDVAIPTNEEVIAELAAPYPLTEDQIAFFRENGFIKLKEVISPGAVLKLRAKLVRLLRAEFGVDPDAGARDRFLSLEMIWPDNPLLRA